VLPEMNGHDSLTIFSFVSFIPSYSQLGTELNGTASPQHHQSSDDGPAAKSARLTFPR
jgi:hypothetical protein